MTQLNESLVKETKTEERLPEKKIGNKTRPLSPAIHEGNTLQSDLHKIVYPI